MPINIPPLITNTGNETSLFGSGGISPAGGVTTLNGLDGVVQILAASGTSGIGFTNDVLLNQIRLTTAGQAQAPLSVTTAGVVSAGQLTGAGFGLGVPTTPAGTACINSAVVGVQSINFVIGNYRIQGGFAATDAVGSNVGLTWTTPFQSSPALYTATTNVASPTASSVANPTNGVVSSLLASTNFYWLAIGPA
jgi:hypothetical protein